MEHITIGFAMTGSFCTFETMLRALKRLKERYETVIPIMSEHAAFCDTRFGSAERFIEQMEEICRHPVQKTLQEVEPFGPKKLLDLLVIAPCTGNTLAKLSAGIADSTVTFAAKAHLRNGRPVVLSVSTNDGLSAAARNIGDLLNRKNYYFVPFGQDDPHGKPTSLIADVLRIPETVHAALQGVQLQPLLI
ncbi:MAG: dipicolinate synthase subunit B [Oscillospiraceae bacterium]|nr:dipicolinate synthase subunit B [Oscillospiraceae bacterium]